MQRVNVSELMKLITTFFVIRTAAPAYASALPGIACTITPPGSYCTNCGNPLTTGIRYCSRCGTAQQ